MNFCALHNLCLNGRERWPISDHVAVQQSAADDCNGSVGAQGAGPPGYGNLGMASKPKVAAATVPVEDARPLEIVAPVAQVAAAPVTETTTDAAQPEMAKPETVTTNDVNMSAPLPTLGAVDIKKGMEKAMKSTEELVAFGQGNIEAFVKSSQIWTAGLQDLSKQFAATAQANLDETMNAFKAFSGVKSLKDAIDLQTNFARAAFEKSMAESGKLTDASFKLTEQALAPISQRMTAAIDSIVKPV